MHEPDGALLVDDAGTIAWSGAWPDRPLHDAVVVDHAGAYLLPGFIDTHLHYPQVHCLDSFGGGRLLDWLERVVFPAESRLAADADAAAAAQDFCSRLIRAGTTTALVFGSQFPGAQQSLATEVRRTGLRVITGRTIMTEGPSSAAALITDEETALALVRDEIDEWLPRCGVDSPFAGIALVPRFALSVGPSLMRSLGALHEEWSDQGLYVTTHLGEDVTEAELVRARFDVAEYLDVYDGRIPGTMPGEGSVLGRRTVLAHAVHTTPAELRRICDASASIAHCPVSQGFLGSGTLPWSAVRASGVRVAMGTDIAAGDEWFMPRVLNACFKAHMNEPAGPVALHPAELLHLATVSGAQALDLDERVGNLDAGKQADFVVLDPSRCPELAEVLDDREPRADPVAERDALLFALLMSAREAAVASVYVGGQRIGP